MGNSVIGPGRMRETDRVRGADCDTPNAPGVYRIRDKASGEIVYIGQTGDVRTRLQQHERSGRFDPETQKASYGIARDGALAQELCDTEKLHIARHRPSGNKTAGGNGRR